MTQTHRATGEALLVPLRNQRSQVGRITGGPGKSVDAAHFKFSNRAGPWGKIDVRRHKKITYGLLEKYFLGNGLLTWMLSPLNLLADLLSHRNRVIYTLEDMPADHRCEIETCVWEFVDNGDRIKAHVAGTLEQNKRCMLTFRWFNTTQVTALRIPAFERDYRFIKTIADLRPGVHAVGGQAARREEEVLAIDQGLEDFASDPERVGAEISPTGVDTIKGDVHGWRHEGVGGGTAQQVETGTEVLIEDRDFPVQDQRRGRQ